VTLRSYSSVVGHARVSPSQVARVALRRGEQRSGAVVAPCQGPCALAV
jgi:transcription termination factor Rho